MPTSCHRTEGRACESAGEHHRLPQSGVRLLDESDRYTVWEEIFEPGIPTPAHRHVRDYVAFFPAGGELTLTHVDGSVEEYAVLSGALTALSSSGGAARFAIAAGTAFRSRVPLNGTSHVAHNEGSEPLRMVLIEFK